MATYRREATETLVKLFTELLPVKLTEEQVTQVQDACYDLTRELMNAVADEYHVVSKG